MSLTVADLQSAPFAGHIPGLARLFARRKRIPGSMLRHECLLSSETVAVDAHSLEHAGDFELATRFNDLNVEAVVYKAC